MPEALTIKKRKSCKQEHKQGNPNAGKMRLMNTTSFELYEFFSSQIPYYAILSHRWGEKEVTFQDLSKETRTQMKGWGKVAGACFQANSDGWNDIGTKSSMESIISSVTGIEDLRNFRTASVAQKMSWASRRRTLRVEDIAYSLLGIFGVHMPLIYGEGENAFLRLQLEILKSSTDESIFAWWCPPRAASKRIGGLLAGSPVDFGNSGDIIEGTRTWKSQYSMTNRGLQIQVEFFGSTKYTDLDMIRLNCIEKSTRLPVQLWLSKSRIDADSYVRKNLNYGTSLLAEFPHLGEQAIICVRQVDESSLHDKQLLRRELTPAIQRRRRRLPPPPPQQTFIDIANLPTDKFEILEYSNQYFSCRNCSLSTCRTCAFKHGSSFGKRSQIEAQRWLWGYAPTLFVFYNSCVCFALAFLKQEIVGGVAEMHLKIPTKGSTLDDTIRSFKDDQWESDWQDDLTKRLLTSETISVCRRKKMFDGNVRYVVSIACS